MAIPIDLVACFCLCQNDKKEVKRYDRIFPHVNSGAFVSGTVPERYELDVAESSALSFKPVTQLTHIENETKAVSEA